VVKIQLHHKKVNPVLVGDKSTSTGFFYNFMVQPESNPDNFLD